MRILVSATVKAGIKRNGTRTLRHEIMPVSAYNNGGMD